MPARVTTSRAAADDEIGSRCRARGIYRPRCHASPTCTQDPPPPGPSLWITVVPSVCTRAHIYMCPRVHPSYNQHYPTRTPCASATCVRACVRARARSDCVVALPEVRKAAINRAGKAAAAAFPG